MQTLPKVADPMTAARIVVLLALLAGLGAMGAAVWRVVDRPGDYARWKANGGRR